MIIYGALTSQATVEIKRKGLSLGDNDFETSNLPAKECLYVSVLGRD